MTTATVHPLLPAQDHAARRDSVRALLADENHAATWLLVTDPRNVRYLAGFSGSNGQVLLGPDPDDDRLITDARYTARAAVEAPGLERTLTRDPFAPALQQAVSARLAVEADHLSWAQGQTLRGRARDADVDLVPTTGLVERPRLVKDDAEVARIARACAITEDALQWLAEQHLRPGLTERDLAIRLERRFVDTGADGIAFPSIVAAGPNGAVPHHDPTDRPLQAGKLVTIDCGALVDGYHADHTRTFAVPGAPPDAQLVEAHEVVLAAQTAGRDAARAGASGHDIDAAARSLITEAGYGEHFVHGTGHGVGLAIHEAPTVAQGAAASLPVGTVLTVEPGIYLPGHGGIRIEDTLALVADGPARPLTDTSRRLR